MPKSRYVQVATPKLNVVMVHTNDKQLMKMEKKAKQTNPTTTTTKTNKQSIQLSSHDLFILELITEKHQEGLQRAKHTRVHTRESLEEMIHELQKASKKLRLFLRGKSRPQKVMLLNKEQDTMQKEQADYEKTSRK